MTDTLATRRLPPEQWERARAYLVQQARPLEATLFRYWFEQGSLADAIQALESYRNDDGGFGHALEPDLRTPLSSVLATTTAIQLLQKLHVSADHPLVTGAFDYLLATYDPSVQSWPLVPPAAEAAPHAPWWNQAGLADRFGSFALNPRAEVLGYLYTYGGPATIDLRASLTPLVLESLMLRQGELSNDDYLCVLRLAGAPGAPPELRGQLEEWLVRVAPRVVAFDPAAWGGYVLLPIQAAPMPDALLAGPYHEPVQASLDFVIDSQGPDGSWAPTWSWFGAYPADWSAADRDWRGVLTLERLRWLQHYGRL